MSRHTENDELRGEYSPLLIKSGERGRYVDQYREGTNIVLIDPDSHAKFPDSEAVNDALRDYLKRIGSSV